MSRHIDQSVAPQVLTQWQSRLIVIRQKLAESPNSEHAWFWQIQCQIIDYLLHRYSGETILPLDLPPEAVPVETPKPPSAPAIAVRPSKSFGANTGMGKMPRDGNQIRPALVSIIHGNHERHQLLQSFRRKMEEAIRLERAQARSSMYYHRQDQLKRNATRKFVEEHLRRLLDQLGISEAEMMELPDDKIEELFGIILRMDSPADESKPTEENKPAC